MSKYLLEIGVEEFPATYIEPKGVCPRSCPRAIASVRSSFRSSARAMVRPICATSSVCVMRVR
jgi:hypothetical protein